MEDDLAQFEAPDVDEMRAEAGDDLLAGKKKGDDEDGIIAILIG